MTEPLRLYDPQTADPRKCGSCKFFRRVPLGDQQYPTKEGNCGFRFPPWVKLLHSHARIEGGSEVFENSRDVTLVQDADGCSFWHPSGLTYVRDQVWSVRDQG